MTAPAGSRYLTLDHWRGFASLWVLLFHSNRGTPGLTPDWLGDFVSRGWLGVQVFFVVSGYCIAERVARESQRSGSVTGFLRDRFLRIYPPYWMALLCLLVLNVAAALVKGLPLSTPAVLPAGALNWLAAGAAVEPWLGQATFLLVAWTLTYELGFYLCAAIGLTLAQRTSRPWLMPAWWTLLLVVGLVPALTAWLPLLSLWPHFALGGLVWLAWHRAGTAVRRLAAGTAAIALVWVASWWQPLDIAQPLRFGCGCAWLLLVLRRWDASLAAFAPLRWLGWVGGFSYSLYLIHAPIVGKLGNLLERVPLLARQPLLLLLLSSLVAIPCAWLFYRLIELRSEAFRHRLAWGIKPAATASGSPTA